MNMTIPPPTGARLQDLEPPIPPKIVIQQVAAQHCVTPAELRSRSQSARLCTVRRRAMFMIWALGRPLAMTFGRVARDLGRDDHTTARTAILRECESLGIDTPWRSLPGSAASAKQIFPETRARALEIWRAGAGPEAFGDSRDRFPPPAPTLDDVILRMAETHRANVFDIKYSGTPRISEIVRPRTLFLLSFAAGVPPNDIARDVFSLSASGMHTAIRRAWVSMGFEARWLHAGMRAHKRAVAMDIWREGATPSAFEDAKRRRAAE